VAFCVIERPRAPRYTGNFANAPDPKEVVMTGLGVRSDGRVGDRLAAEIANEPQWVVFEGVVEEEAWAEEELAEISFVFAWAATIR
jgi:hypothetical protein